MKKIIVLIAMLCAFASAECKTYGSIGTGSVDIYCDRAAHENHNIKKSMISYFERSDFLIIIYTYNDGSYLRKSYTGYKEDDITSVSISLNDEANITIKEKNYDSDYIDLKTIYREYRNEHNLTTYAETLALD